MIDVRCISDPKGQLLDRLARGDAEALKLVQIFAQSHSVPERMDPADAQKYLPTRVHASGKLFFTVDKLSVVVEHEYTSCGMHTVFLLINI